MFSFLSTCTKTAFKFLKYADKKLCNIQQLLYFAGENMVVWNKIDSGTFCDIGKKHSNIHVYMQ